MSNLIQDLMKLDLNKFSSKNSNQTRKNVYDFSNRRNSADQVVIIDADSMPKTTAGLSSPYNPSLPVNSPQVYYSPVNVNGNNNIVNTNVQIVNMPKGFNCSQKLFLGSPEHEDITLRIQSHKRVNSMSEQAQLIKTPVVLNKQLNFGFGGN